MKLTYGVGFNSKGKYKTKINGKYTKAYTTWYSMLGRCYRIKSLESGPTYIGCSVTEEWHDYQVYAEWFNNQAFGDCGYHLDKDILIGGNKIYGPDTCAFIPTQINSLFTDSKAARGKYPVGVHKLPNGKFVSQVGLISGKRKYLGCFNSALEAYTAYKIAKEANVKAVANLWKGKIDDRVYNKLMKWELPE